ncbi:MAG TPA: TssQ family T6SS-associated lipoprotein [Burkholderiales bacterium]
MIVLATLVSALAGCATQQMRDLRALFKPSKGYHALRLGIQQFEDGGYVDAARHLQLAIDMGLHAGERIEAHKYLAFIHCASGREGACRDEFRRALAADPDFTLGPAERGHPVWGPVFASLKGGGAIKVEEHEPELKTAPEPKSEPPKAEAKAEAKGEPVLKAALRLYEEGNYVQSAKSLQAAIDQGLENKDRARAHKYLAFIHCAASREQQCREEFSKALAVDPSLDLAPAEAGHPIWGPVFRAVKAGR